LIWLLASRLVMAAPPTCTRRTEFDHNCFAIRCVVAAWVAASPVA
jgi:hypothetical protein